MQQSADSAGTHEQYSPTPPNDGPLTATSPVRQGLRRAAATAVPVAIPLAMRAVFRGTTRRLGPRRGYQAGMAVYWATCWATAAGIAGPRRLAATFRSAGVPLPEPAALAVSLLAVPPAGALATEFLPHARRVGWAALATSIGVGVTNALAEEALWRGLPVAVFPDRPVRGWLWPATGFTAWHLVPLAAAGTGPRRSAMVLLGASLIGFGSGWVAFKTRSVAAVVGPHALTDSCGVRAARRTWLGRLG